MSQPLDHMVHIQPTYCMFSSVFMELIVDRIDFVEIDLVKINFEVK